ncbi:hypothetical protein [Nonomuraea sp. NPDC050786]|uniref:hypothetical protein n=1 Tax=Nonomuraea sp. NPDC050786 TaxID=3154840 RepID=UPI0033DECBB3
MAVVEPELLEGKFAELASDIAGAFGRVEPRQTANAYLRGLLSDIPRKNCWHLARHAGDLGPDKMQAPAVTRELGRRRRTRCRPQLRG